ncbi:MAG: hypothetical protein WA997_11600 [Anaerolineales bacterium]|nr:hypothetical protein [Anaerolineales bacterium]HUV27475.1 hypothetical protein [Anaerolineales bacterium]
MEKERPIGVTILAVLAGIAALIAAFHALQFLGIIKFNFGPFSFRNFNLFAALMYGLLVWVYVWLVQMLWKVDPSAWIFLVVITLFNLILDFLGMIGAGAGIEYGWSIFFNGIILIYCMLPGVRNTFGTK